eukprot:COSAG04_NODE_1097_length_8281_cov_3.149597_4_plen_915_part_00
MQKPVKGGKKYIVDFEKQRTTEVVERSAIVEMAPGQLRRHNQRKQPEQQQSPQSPARGSPKRSRSRAAGGGGDPLLAALDAELSKARADATPRRSMSQSRASSRLGSPNRSMNGRLGSPERRGGAGARLGSPDRRQRAGRGEADSGTPLIEPDPWEPTPQHFDDAQMQRFVVEGFVSLEGGTGLSAAFHAEVARRCEALQLHQAAANVLSESLLSVVPQLLHVFSAPAVDKALESVLGRGYAMHPRHESHATVPGTECEVWHRAPFGGRFGRRHHRLRQVCAVYFPQKTTVELGSLDVAAGSQYCTLRSHSALDSLAHELPGDAADAALIDWLAVDAFPDSWGTSRPLVLPAGAVVLMHADIWHRVAANVSARARRFCVTAQFIRTEEPVAPTWRYVSPAWTVGTTPAGSPPLKPLWWSVWSWLCGGIASAVEAALGDARDTHPGDPTELGGTLRWATAQEPVPPERTAPPSSFSAAPGEEAAALSVALAAAHTDAVRAKLAKAQQETQRAERQILALKRTADEATTAAVVVGSEAPDGAKAGTLMGTVKELRQDVAAKSSQLEEAGVRAKREKEKAGAAKDEAVRLRKELRRTEADTAKARSRCDGLQQEKQSLQARLLTIGTAHQQNRPWDSAWDAWLPAHGGSFSPRFREKKTPEEEELMDDFSKMEAEATSEVMPQAYSPTTALRESQAAAQADASAGLGLTSWGGEGMDGGWGSGSPGATDDFGGFGGGRGADAPEEIGSPALRLGNQGLEMELQIQEGVEKRVGAERNRLRKVACDGLERSQRFRAIRAVFDAWMSWVEYTIYREGVQKRALARAKIATRMKVWRAWVGWAAARQVQEQARMDMEERFGDVHTHGKDKSDHDISGMSPMSMSPRDDGDGRKAAEGSLRRAVRCTVLPSHTAALRLLTR